MKRTVQWRMNDYKGCRKFTVYISNIKGDIALIVQSNLNFFPPIIISSCDASNTGDINKCTNDSFRESYSRNVFCQSETKDDRYSSPSTLLTQRTTISNKSNALWTLSSLFLEFLGKYCESWISNIVQGLSWYHFSCESGCQSPRLSVNRRFLDNVRFTFIK